MDLMRHESTARAAPRAAALMAAGPTAGGARPVVALAGRRKEHAGVSASRGGMRPDLDEVFRRDYRQVVAVAARVLGSRDEAEDVAQEVFLDFARSAVPASQARGWLAVAAAHAALNTLRSGRRRTTREERSVVAEPMVVSDVAETVVVLEERTRVRAALARLPRKHAVAQVLRHSGLSYADVAAALDLSPTSVGTTVRRAESALREELTRHASSH